MNNERRLPSLDFLRGIAVILMVQQHLVAWFWHVPREGALTLLKNHPLLVGLNGLGGLAAPLFTLLAGVGAVLMYEKSTNASRNLPVRGMMLFAMAYLLNVAVPSWFAPGSWYVLHLIALGLLLSPLLLRLPGWGLVILVIAILNGTAALQYWLQTPYFTSNARMADMSLPGGVFRLMFVEGHFPVFPWLTFFIMGILTGRWMKNKRLAQGIKYLFFFMAAGFLLALAGTLFPGVTNISYLSRLTNRSPLFYPAMVPFTLVMSSGISMAILFFTRYFSEKISSRSPVSSTGRISLTVIMIHIPLFREVLVQTGYYRTFSSVVSVAVTLAVSVVIIYISVIWRRIGFAYGFEWLLRRFDT